MDFKNLILTVENKVAQLVINRPEKANSMTEAAWNELKEALIYCDETPEIRAIVFSGAGEKLFCAGIDLQMLMTTN
jgi:enoyl-CoA hydratase